MSTAQWANIGEDAGALHALIARIPEHVAVATVDYLWIFPPRKIAIGESIVVVVAAFDEDDARRRVSTAHFTVARNKKGVPTVSVRYAEHGSAPVNAVPRIVEGVLRRLGEDIEAAPREEQIEGEPERWNALIVELGGRIPDADVDTGTDTADHDTRSDESEPIVDAADSTPADSPGGSDPDAEARDEDTFSDADGASDRAG